MEINRQAPLVAQKTVFIQAAPETVWKLQAEINAWKDWQTDISRSELSGPLQVGGTFRWTSGGFGVTSTLQEVEPQHRLAWTGQALGSYARHIWVFTPENGGTRVSTEESMEGWLIALLKPLMPDFLDKSLTVWVDNLKRQAESRGA